jgi:transposase
MPKPQVWPENWSMVAPVGAHRIRTTHGASEKERSLERTFAWLGQSPRLSKDYERLPATSEAMIDAAMSRLMLRGLARTPV